jgi:N-acetylmuramoyl-L-alanine amidase
MATHIIQQGECLSSIASQYGFFWQQIWNDSANSKLKNLRKDPNVLKPGDKIAIPEKTVKSEQAATEGLHRFRCKGVPVSMRLVLMDAEGQPRADEPYTLDIDGYLFSGTSDADGTIECPISPCAKQGRLIVGQDGKEEYLLRLGHLDPVDEISGIQGRLENLGYSCGGIDGKMGPKTESALCAFQKRYGLEQTGNVDENTRNKLTEIHGS